MKILLSWLRDYVEIDLSPDEIAHKLTMAGLEVESIESLGPKFTGVVVGEVILKEKHPNADKLSLCKVSIGQADLLSIVCGASNVAVGQKVPVAVVGAKLPGDFEIKSAKIRGEASFGMICSESELGFSEEKSPGIWELSSDATVGQDFATYLNLSSDTLFDVSITANRGDCLSHIGIAREVAALTGKELKLPDASLNPETLTKADSSEKISIQIEDEINCSFYAGWYLSGVKAVESPEWLKYRLTALGLRPRNILVDATNYVLMETGQPLHAFDYDQLQSKSIKIASFSNRDFTTLDSKKRQLPEQSLMICTGEEPIAIAGIMGGENSEVVDSTTSVLLEGAVFKAGSVRKTAKRLGISTDASYRFERGIDADMTLFAMKRAIQIITDVTGGKAAFSPVIEKTSDVKKIELSVRFHQIKRILGIEIPKEKTINILTALGLSVVGESATELWVRIPGHRNDITREIDVIEEIIRIYGFEHLPETVVSSISLQPEMNHDYRNQHHLKLILTGMGFYEGLSSSLVSKKEAELFSDASVPVLNPQSEDMSWLRPSFAPTVLQAVSRNLNQGVKNIRLFEIGNCFQLQPSRTWKKVENYYEFRSLGIVLSGNWTSKQWNQEEKISTFYDLKGIIEQLLQLLRVGEKVQWIETSQKGFTSSWNAQVSGLEIATIGEIHPDILSFYGVSQNVYYADIQLDNIISLEKKILKYQELSKYLPVDKDLAFWVNQSIAVGDLIQAIYSVNKDQIKNVSVFDVYEPKNQTDGKKSVAFTVTFENHEKTFTDDEINLLMSEIAAKLSKDFQAQLRGN